MKHNYSILIIILFLLPGCALFKKTDNLTAVGCNEEWTEKLKTSVSKSHEKIIQCLQANKRDADAAAFKTLLSQKNISLLCESSSKNQMVSAEYPGAKNFPGLKFNTTKIDKVEKNAKLDNGIFHESIHWLGYKHYQDVDLSYIAETCCLDHSDTRLNKLAKQSCELFKYQKNDWQKPQYITELTRSLTPFGRGFVGVHTSISAAAQIGRNSANIKLIYPVLFAPLEEVNSSLLGSKMSRAEIAKHADSNSIVYALILNRLVSKSSDEKLLRRSVALSRTLARRFYAKSADLEKLQYFLNVAEVIEAVIVKNPETLTEAWGKLKSRSEYMCRDLKKFESDSIEDLLGYASPYLFDLKNQIPPGDFYEMATYWDNPCDLFKAESKTHE